jgi:predicted MFS family arabinose efflux permease
MVATVNTAMVGACAGLLVQTLGVASLPFAVAAGVIVGMATMLIQPRHQQHARATPSGQRPSIAPRS